MRASDSESEFFGTADERRLGPRDLVGREFQVGERPDERRKRDARFEAGQRCPETMVSSVAERQMLHRAAGDVELLRVVELPGVAVGRGQNQQDPLAGLDLVAAQFEVLLHAAGERLRRPVVAQDLLDGLRHERRVVPERLQLLWVAE